MGKVEEVKKKDKLLAMIIRNDYECEGVDFITPNDYSQQVAYMHHPTGKVFYVLTFMMSMKIIWNSV